MIKGKNALKAKENILTLKRNLPRDKIKVSFIVQMPEIWDKEAPVFEALLRDDRFDACLIVVPHYDYSKDKLCSYGDELEYFRNKTQYKDKESSGGADAMLKQAKEIKGMFVYPRDKHGHEYGWGWALLTTPEQLLGKEACHCDRTPQESLQRMMTHLKGILPRATEKQLMQLLK